MFTEKISYLCFKVNHWGTTIYFGEMSEEIFALSYHKTKYH